MPSPSQDIRISNLFRTIIRGCSLALLAASLWPLGDPKVQAQQPTTDSSLPTAWSIEQGTGKLILKESGRRVAIFHYQDDQCHRPFFSHVCTVTGKQVTRNYPPISGVDPDDHATMHGGIWLGFGDINGEDFWRNKALMEHTSFSSGPTINAQGISFTSQSTLKSSAGKEIGTIEQTYRLRRIELGYSLVWTAYIQAAAIPLVLGDQEEMGLGVRVATDMTEKNGGRIQNSEGKTTARETWGKAARWADYSKTHQGKRLGIVLMPDPENFKPSWFHNRDYGLMVANCFGNKSFTQGEPSQVRIEPNEKLRLSYQIYWYECDENEKLPLERMAFEPRP